MAVDTKAKRASVQAYTFGLMRPPPTGTIGEAARATITWLFSGLDYQAPVAAVAGYIRRPFNFNWWES